MFRALENTLPVKKPMPSAPPLYFGCMLIIYQFYFNFNML